MPGTSRQLTRGVRLLAFGLAIAIALGTALARAQAVQNTPEQWYNPGIGPGAPRGLAAFAAKTDAAFVGLLQKVSVEFVDEKQEWLFTILMFKPTEWIKPSTHLAAGSIEVLTLGGTYVVTNGHRVARRPAELAEGLQIGAEYFVPVDFEERPQTAWTGRYVLLGIDAFCRLDKSDVIPVLGRSTWPAAILEQSPKTLSAPSQFPSRRELFLATLRAAVAAKR